MTILTHHHYQPDKGDLEIWRNRVVVADDEVEDDNSETSPLPKHAKNRARP
jgi:hypothetical protein